MFNSASYMLSAGAISSALPMKRGVLPRNVLPKHYDLTLEPNWDDFTFEGSVVREQVFNINIPGYNDPRENIILINNFL